LTAHFQPLVHHQLPEQQQVVCVGVKARSTKPALHSEAKATKDLE
jgi:hypothetical protein